MSSTVTSRSSGEPEAASGVCQEIKAHFSIASPICLTFLLRKSTDLVSIIFVGHLVGTVNPADGFSTTAHFVACSGLGSVTANVTGNSMIIGLAGALSTICSQAWGAQDMQTYSTTLQKAIIILWVCICAPVTVIWLFSEYILIALGQQPMIALHTSHYLMCLIPNLWALSSSFCIQSWLYARSNTKPSVAITLITAIMHPIWCYFYIYVLNLGFLGAAVAVSTTKCLELTLYIVYITLLSNVLVDSQFQWQWPSFCRRSTAASSSMRPAVDNIYSLSSWWPFLRLGLPNMMMMTEWWASEIIIFMSGMLSHDADVTEANLGAMTIYQNILSLCFMIPSGLSVSASTRVGNFLGSNDPGFAKLSATVASSMAAALSSAIAIAITVFGEDGLRLYTSDRRILHVLSTILIVLLAYVAADGVQSALSGVLKGLGKQRIGGPIVVFSYYVVGIPISSILAFSWGFGLGVLGLCIGTTIGTWTHMALFGVVIARVNWFAEAETVQSRLSHNNPSHNRIHSSNSNSNNSGNSKLGADTMSKVRFTPLGDTDYDNDLDDDVSAWLDELTGASSHSPDDPEHAARSGSASSTGASKSWRQMTADDVKVSAYNFVAGRLGWKKMMSEYELVSSCTDVWSQEAAAVDDVVL